MKHLTEKQIETLERQLEDHDCHLSPDDGCICLEIREKLYGKPYEGLDKPF